jgi:hypothetical protein
MRSPPRVVFIVVALLIGWCCLRRASLRESGGLQGPPCEGVTRSVPCAEDGSRRRDPPSPLRTPPGCDAPRRHALLGRFGKLESYPCLQQPSPPAPSLASSPPAIALCLVLVGHPSPDAAAHRGIELVRRLWASCTRDDECPFRVQIPRPRCPKHAGQEFAALQRRDQETSAPGPRDLRGVPAQGRSSPTPRL